MAPAKQNPDTMFTCNYCTCKYAHKGSLNNHVKNKHKEETEAKQNYDVTKSIVEDILSNVLTRDIPKTKLTLTKKDLTQMFDEVAESYEAMKAIEKDSCEICGKTLEFLETIDVHMKNHHAMTSDDNPSEDLSKKLTCKGCDKNIWTNNYKDETIKRKNECISQLGERLRKMSVEKRTLALKLKMMKSSTEIDNVSKGMEHTRSNGNKYKCKQCPFNTNVIALIGRHIIQKHSNKNICKHCDKTFSFKDTLRRHIKHKHQIQIVDESGKVVGIKLNCGECKNKDEVLKHKEAELDKKEKHIRKVTPKSNELKKAKEEIELARTTIADNVKLINRLIIERDTQKARADIVSNQTGIQEEQEIEVETEEIPELPEKKCKRCSYSTRSLEDLRKHMEEVHKIGVACPICNKTFVFMSDMKKHKRIVHDHATHNCNVCKAVFQTKKGMTDHRQTRCRTPATAASQTNEVSGAELKCHYCEYKTSNQDQFISHMAYHSNTTKYTCMTCREEFNDKSNLINHQVTIHRTCSYCKTSFQTFEQIEKHICPKHAFLTIPEQRRRLRRMNTECTSGQHCEHKRKGRCWFKHSLVTNNNQHEGQENQSWCKYQDRCDRRQICSYKHYDDIGQGELAGPGVQAGQGAQAGQGGLAGQGGQAGQGGVAGQQGHGGQGGPAGQAGQGEQAAPSQDAYVRQPPMEWLPRLQCHKCSYQTNSQNELIYHFETRHQQESFQCDNCPNTFKNSESLVTHIVVTHTGKQRQNVGFLNASFQENF